MFRARGLGYWQHHLPVLSWAPRGHPWGRMPRADARSGSPSGGQALRDGSLGTGAEAPTLTPLKDVIWGPVRLALNLATATSHMHDCGQGGGAP